MNRYERIRFDGKTIILRNPRKVKFCGIDAITGIRVDKLGDEVGTKKADEQRDIIAAVLVTKRTKLRWDMKYGELVTDKQINEGGS